MICDYILILLVGISKKQNNGPNSAVNALQGALDKCLAQSNKYDWSYDADGSNDSDELKGSTEPSYTYELNDSFEPKPKTFSLDGLVYKAKHQRRTDAYYNAKSHNFYKDSYHMDARKVALIFDEVNLIDYFSKGVSNRQKFVGLPRSALLLLMDEGDLEDKLNSGIYEELVARNKSEPRCITLTGAELLKLLRNDSLLDDVNLQSSQIIFSEEDIENNGFLSLIRTAVEPLSHIFKTI